MNATANPPAGLTPTQQSMLDLALACDLKVADPAQHDAIRARHKTIQNQRDAADYIREVENKVHSRRRFARPAKALAAPAVAPASPAVAPVPAGNITSTQAGIAIVALVVFMVVTGWFVPAGGNLIFVAVSLLLLMGVLGWATTGRALGILINERNLMSLARFQTVVWTVVVLSAYLTFALVRIRQMATGAPIDDPLAIQVDWHLWALLGFSTTSLVGAPLILSTKQDQQPLASATQRAAQMTHESTADVDANRHGTLYANGRLSDARLTDLFEGDELINTARLDLAKVQMFYFTIIAAICVFVMVFKQLATGGSNLDHLPVLPDGLVAILGISHAGYLGSKGITRTQSQPAS
jgi:hypothetical protein